MELAIANLYTTITEMEADRRTFIRHQQTLGRHMRRILESNKQLRIDKNTLIKYVESVSEPG